MHGAGTHAARPRAAPGRAGAALGGRGGPRPIAADGRRPARRPGTPSRSARRGAAATRGRGPHRLAGGDPVGGRAPAPGPDPRRRSARSARERDGRPLERRPPLAGAAARRRGRRLRVPRRARGVRARPAQGRRPAGRRTARRAPVVAADHAASRSSSPRCWRGCSRSSDEKRPAAVVNTRLGAALAPRLRDRPPPAVVNAALGAAEQRAARQACSAPATPRNASQRRLSRRARRLASLPSSAASASAVEALSLSRRSATSRSSGADRVLDEDQREVLAHLQVALALGEADDVVLAAVQPQLGRLEQAEQRRVVGEHADRPHLGAGGDHLDLVVEDLPLGGEDLDAELRACHVPA